MFYAASAHGIGQKGLAPGDPSSIKNDKTGNLKTALTAFVVVGALIFEQLICAWFIFTNKVLVVIVFGALKVAGVLYNFIVVLIFCFNELFKGF